MRKHLLTIMDKAYEVLTAQVGPWWNPGQALRLSGAMGPLQAWGLAGSWIWALKMDATGTQVSMQYAAGGYMQGGFEKLAPAVNGMMAEQITRYQAFIDTGKPDPAKP